MRRAPRRTPARRTRMAGPIQPAAEIPTAAIDTGALSFVEENDVLVRHGYYYWQLQHLAHMSARRLSFAGGDYSELCDVAFVAIVELLWARQDPPDEWEIRNAGFDAARRHGVREHAVHGRAARGRYTPKFTMFWTDLHCRGASNPATERLVERIALGQVFAALPERDQDILWTRAMFPTAAAAAVALNLHPGNFSRCFTRARRKALRLWFDQETPISWAGRQDRWARSEGGMRDRTARQRVARRRVAQ